MSEEINQSKSSVLTWLAVLSGNFGLFNRLQFPPSTCNEIRVRIVSLQSSLLVGRDRAPVLLMHSHNLRDYLRESCCSDKRIQMLMSSQHHDRTVRPSSIQSDRRTTMSRELRTTTMAKGIYRGDREPSHINENH